MCCVYYGVSLHYICIPFITVRVFFLDYCRKWLGQVRHTHGMTSDIRASTLHFLSPFWMTRWLGHWTTGHMILFFSIQFDAPSMGKLMDIYVSSYMIQCSYSHFFISTLASRPLLGAKLCHILDLST